MVELPDPLSGRDRQLLTDQALVHTGAPFWSVERQPMSSGSQRVAERRDRRVGTRSLEFGHGGLADPQSAGEIRLREAGAAAGVFE